eukprot:3415461-Rhodomonas_salina.1
MNALLRACLQVASSPCRLAPPLLLFPHARVIHDPCFPQLNAWSKGAEERVRPSDVCASQGEVLRSLDV